MAGTDSTFSAAGSNQSISVVGAVVNVFQVNRGNPNGDVVDNSTLIEDGFNGTYGQSAKIGGSIQYNPNSFYPNS
jgi:hypothetical protein